MQCKDSLVQSTYTLTFDGVPVDASAVVAGQGAGAAAIDAALGLRFRGFDEIGRAMQALGVELILARSPQAKGRVERMNGVLQDRLVKALRLAGIADLVGAAGM